MVDMSTKYEPDKNFNRFLKQNDIESAYKKNKKSDCICFLLNGKEIHYANTHL